MEKSPALTMEFIMALRMGIYLNQTNIFAVIFIPLYFITTQSRKVFTNFPEFEHKTT